MKKRIAIAAGGDSGEFEISIQSAEVVKHHLDTELYESYLIIFRNDEWFYTTEENEIILINRDDFSLLLRGRKILFDAVFMAIHGTPGEDGKLQGYFDKLDIPYTACGQVTSALTFNKYNCNHFVSGFGINIAPSVLFIKDKLPDFDAVIKTVGIPCFVKPNKGGSSVGMSKVDQPGLLASAVEKAFAEDDQVLVEGYISGREISCGVTIYNGKVRSLPITEIISKNEFFDYEAKYTDGMAEEITPAQITAEVEQRCRVASELLFEKLACKGFVRFDYIFNDEGLYFLEVNTIPGLTQSSIVPKQAMEAGISLRELFSMAIEQAL